MHQCKDDARVQNLRTVITVVVIADGFASDEEEIFRTSLLSVQTGFGILQTSGDGAVINVKDAPFVPVHSGRSALGIKHQDCSVADKCPFEFKDALPNIEKIGKPYGATHYLVVFNHDGKCGCADGTTMVVESGISESGAAHEGGHAIAGLYDERETGDGPALIDETNCTAYPENPPWLDLIENHTINGPPIRGCNHSSSFFRPLDDDCRMRAVTIPHFCPQCERLIKKVLERRTSAPSILEAIPLDDVSSDARSVEFTAMLSEDGTFDVLDAHEIDAREIATPVIVGDTFAVVEGDAPHGKQRVIYGVQSLAMDDGDRRLSAEDDRRVKLYARCYSENGIDRRVPVPARLVRMTIVGVPRADIRHRNLQLTLRKLVQPGRGTLFTTGTRARLGGAAIDSVPVDVSTALVMFDDWL